MKPEQQEALRAPFPRSAIGKMPKGGVTLDYVGHAATTDRLLSVDPEWAWEPVAFDGRGLPALDEFGGLWIRLTVCGVTRYGYGDAAGKKGPNAVKEAIGDAIRNAAMRFGVALDLWAKEDISNTTPAVAEGGGARPGEAVADGEGRAASPVHPDTEARFKRMQILLRERFGNDRPAAREWIGVQVGRAIGSTNDLDAREVVHVVAVLDGRKPEAVAAA